MLIATTSEARDSVKGNPDAFVHVQEISSNYGIMHSRYCPLASGKRFKQNCAKGRIIDYLKYSNRKYADIVKLGEFKYMIDWHPPKTTTTYAWVSAWGPNSDFSLKQGVLQETLLAKFAVGTVVVHSLYTKGSKAERAAALKRTKAAFAQKYGALVNQMKFVHVRVAPVICAKKSNTPKDGYNCVLQ